MAVGAPGSDSSRGAVYFVHLNANGTAKSVAKLSSGINGVPTLAAEDSFAQVTSLGDLNGDGTIDIAVGARGTDGAGTDRGAIYVLLLNSVGTVKSSSRIDNSITWNPNVQDDDVFGETLVAVGDVDGDGIVDLATTSRIPFNVSGNLNNEIIDLLFLNTDGTAKRVTRLGTVADPVFPRSSVVQNISAVGDINGDGIPDLAVTGFDQTDIRNPVLMAWFLTLNANGTAGRLIQLPPMDSGTFGLMSDWRFVASMGDANSDGSLDVAVGMPFYNGFPNSTPGITVVSLATRAPKIPGVPILTGNPASTTSPRPSISWLESSHADSYEIWLSTFNTGEVVARSVPVYGTSWAPPTDPGIGRYAAWVRATNSVGKSAWSLRYDFTVTTATTMNATPDGINRRPPLTWQPLAGAAKYEIWVSNANTPLVPVIRTITANSDTTFRPAVSLNEGTYRVWVRGVAKDNTTGQWSAFDEFTIASRVSLTEITHQFIPQPRITFTALPGAATYQTWITDLDNRAAAPIRETIDRPWHTFRPNVIFEPAAALSRGRHRIWIRAVGEDGSLGDWSAPMDFVTYQVPQLTVPGSFNASELSKLINWTTTTGAANYDLWISNHQNVLVLRDRNIFENAYDLRALLPVGNYRIWVRAVSGSGMTSPWSLPGNFSIA